MTWRRIVLLLTAGCLLPSPAPATVLVPLHIEELISRAGLVAHGRVRSIEVRRDSQDRVFTEVFLEPEGVWKGAVAGDGVRLVAGGGRLGEDQQGAEGAPEYVVGEELVVFATANPAREWVVLGLGQGRFIVHTDVVSGERWVSNGFWGTRPTAAAPARRVRAPWQQPLSLRELERRTREAAR